MELTRLDKIIADSGIASRSEAKALIRAGRVVIDGSIASGAEEKYDPEAAEIRVDGVKLNTARFRCFQLYKPAGVLSATEDREQKTVLDLLPPPLRRLGLFPVGRLDKDTTGLLLLTNDGDLAHRIISPKRHIPKVYRAEVDGVLDSEDIAAFAAGILLADGTQCLPARLETVGPSVGRVTVYEGKYHQVKRMFAARKKPVIALHRERVGGLALDPALAPGQFRELTETDLSLLSCENDGRNF